MLELILAHHETILQYLISLFIGGCICFKYLFPMIGRWIVDWKKKTFKSKDETKQRQHDDQCVIRGLYMDERDIEAARRGKED